MCGRYSLALPPSLIRQMLEEDGVPIADAPDDEGRDAPQQSYNFAPGSYGVVCRADTLDASAGLTQDNIYTSKHEGSQQQITSSEERGIGAVKYTLQSMKWGIVPSWANRSSSPLSKAINCRDDSLRTRGGMWQAMKSRKRCVVVAQGFFEWLNVNKIEKTPYFVKRRDGRLMCFAGLWDSVNREDTGDRTYTYAIVTTNSSQRLRFLHNRMPVIFDAGSNDFRQWLHPSHRWTNDLQSSLKPYEGELEIYPVNKKVGKAGCSSPSFILPLNNDNKGYDIPHFFSRASQDSSVAEKPEGSGKMRTNKGNDPYRVSNTDAGLNLSGKTETQKKHKIDGNYSSPSKKRFVKPGPPGVKKITDFFN